MFLFNIKAITIVHDFSSNLGLRNELPVNLNVFILLICESKPCKPLSEHAARLFMYIPHKLVHFLPNPIH